MFSILLSCAPLQNEYGVIPIMKALVCSVLKVRVPCSLWRLQVRCWSIWSRLIIQG